MIMSTSEIIEESSYIWPEKFIEGLYEEPQDPKELINDRFEILDL